MMNETVDVSVIVPVLNAARHLQAAIDSVLMQHPRPSEIIVIDGGSTDGSREIAAGYPCLRVLSQEGRGLARARNQAIHASSGGFVAFCDADDVWMPFSLAHRLQALEDDPTLLAVIGHVTVVEFDGIRATAAQQSRCGQSRPGFTPGALLVKRQAFETIGEFDESLTIGCDSDWFVRLQASHPVCILSETVLQKGARSASLSADTATYRRELLTVAKRFIEHRREGNR